MKVGVNTNTSQIDLYRSRIVRRLIACLALIFNSLTIETAAAAPEDEVRSTFDRFVAAQNAHDVNTVESLLLGSPDFLWITRGMPVWGSDAALKRFAVLYEGTWKLAPELANLKIIMIGDGVAQIYVPIIFTIGAPRPTTATDEISNESALGEDAERLESVEHPAHTCACAMTLARRVVARNE
jgi:hypothetical protein